MARIAIILALMLLPATAFADKQAAMSCANDLNPGARNVFDTTLAKMRGGGQGGGGGGGGGGAEGIKAEMAAMVKAGTPRQDVQAAAGCLKMFKGG